MGDVIGRLAEGNVAEVKTVLTSVAFALAAYQVILAAIGYRKLRPAVLGPEPAFGTHRASGDAIALLLVLVAVACASYFEIEDDAMFHTVTGFALLVVLALKIVVIRWWDAAGRHLPVLGTLVFVLLALTWASSAGSFLGGDG